MAIKQISNTIFIVQNCKFLKMLNSGFCFIYIYFHKKKEFHKLSCTFFFLLYIFTLDFSMDIEETQKHKILNSVQIKYLWYIFLKSIVLNRRKYILHGTRIILSGTEHHIYVNVSKFHCDYYLQITDINFLSTVYEVFNATPMKTKYSMISNGTISQGIKLFCPSVGQRILF